MRLLGNIVRAKLSIILLVTTAESRVRSGVFDNSSSLCPGVTHFSFNFQYLASNFAAKYGDLVADYGKACSPKVDFPF